LWELLPKNNSESAIKIINYCFLEIIGARHDIVVTIVILATAPQNAIGSGL